MELDDLQPTSQFFQGLRSYICISYLKKWLGVTRSLTVCVLYRKKDYFGLDRKRLTDLYKLLQVSKGYTLKNSEDPKGRRHTKISGQARKWSVGMHHGTECKREEPVL